MKTMLNYIIAGTLLVITNVYNVYSQNITKEFNIKQNCAPIDYAPKILFAPDEHKLHEDWIDGEVGTSWSFFATKKIETPEGIFLWGDLISPRGGKITTSCYIIENEWECEME